LRREWFPSIVDIGIEIDSHEGSFDDLIPRARSSDRADDEAVGPDQPGSGDDQGVQSILRYSALFAATGSRGAPIYPLDWQSVRNLFAQLKPAEAEQLCLESTEESKPSNAARSSTFNFDHVTTSYGDVHAGISFVSEALLFPVSYLAASMSSADNRQPLPPPAIVAISSAAGGV